MFTKVLVASGFAALAAAQSSVLGFDHVPNPVTDGQAQAITYHTNDTTLPVTIILKKGETTDLQNVSTLTTDASNGQFIWTPSTSLANGADYALYIQQGSVDNYNYYGPFQIQGANPSAVASASSHSATAYASSSSSSSMSSLSSTTISANGTASTTVPVVTATVGTVGSGSAAGTGTAMARNTTMSIATLTTPIVPSTSASGSATNTATTSGAGFQSASSSAPAASSTNAASGVEISGALSMLFGVAAAAFYLQ